MRLRRLRLELGMALHRHEPRDGRGSSITSTSLPSGLVPENAMPWAANCCAVLVVELVAVPMPFVDQQRLP